MSSKVSALSAVSAADPADTVYLVQSGTSKRATVDQLVAAGSSPARIAFGLPGELAVQNDVSPWFIVPFNGVLTKAYAVAKTPPDGDDLILDVLLSTDDGATFTSLWDSTPANRLTIADGDATGSQTSFDTADVAKGDLLRLDVVQVGSTTAGSDVSITLAASAENS